MAARSGWQDWVSVVLGILLLISPFVFGGTASQAAAGTAFAGGILLVVAGLTDLAFPADHSGIRLEGIVGVLLFVAPWVLGFVGLTAMAWSAWVAGVLAVLLAASVLFTERADQGRVVGRP